MSERNAEWVAEPWHVSHGHYKTDVYSREGTVIQGTPFMTPVGIANAARAAACVNACAGIPNPEEFIKRAKRLEEALRGVLLSAECTHLEDIPREQWDEYDHFMGPKWEAAREALGIPQPSNHQREG